MSESSLSYRLLTYNLHKGMSVGNLRFVLHELRDAVQALACDALLMQEVQGAHEQRRGSRPGWPDIPHSEFLSGWFWSHHAYGRNAEYTHGHHGNAILSRQPIVHWENINVALWERASRSILHAQVALPGVGKPLHLVCVHFGLMARERHQQAGLLAERVHAHVPDGEPLIIGGDFNDWNHALGRRLCAELGVHDAHRMLHGRLARSFPALMPVLPVDRIYVRGVEVRDCRVLGGAPWRRLSDHLPLYCELRI